VTWLAPASLAWRSDISRMLWVTASSCMVIEFN
jgi:hypothetical protein